MSSEPKLETFISRIKKADLKLEELYNNGACGGIILTASHNPRQWNALKLLNEHGEFLNKEEGNEVLRIAEAEAFEFADIDHIGSYREDNTYNQKHIDSVLALKLVDVDAIRKANFRVAIDCVNSVGGIILPELLERLGVKHVEKLYCEATDRKSTRLNSSH